MKSNHSKKRRLNNNTFRRNARVKRKNMTKKINKKILAQDISSVIPPGLRYHKDSTIKNIIPAIENIYILFPPF